MPSLLHTHTYVQYKARSGPGRGIRNKVFRCADPDCTHFTGVEMVLGKKSLCNLCGQEYIISRTEALMVVPRCQLCSNSKEGKRRRAAEKTMANLLHKLDLQKTPINETEQEELIG